MRIFRRFSGYILLVAGISGLVFAIGGFVVFQSVISQAEQAIAQRLIVLDEALKTSAEGLTVAQQALDNVDGSIGSLQTTLTGVSQTITSTLPTLNTLSTVVGEDVPQAITTTRQALQAAQSTAAVADQVLATISGIGLLNTQLYDPEVPLNVAIGRVATSLDGLPESLGDVKRNVNSATTSLRQVQTDLNAVSTSVGTIGESLEKTQNVVTRYQGTIGTLQQEVLSAKESLPTWLAMFRLAGTLVLLWLGAAQLGLIFQGLELLGREPRNIERAEKS